MEQIQILDPIYQTGFSPPMRRPSIEPAVLPAQEALSWYLQRPVAFRSQHNAERIEYLISACKKIDGWRPISGGSAILNWYLERPVAWSHPDNRTRIKFLAEYYFLPTLFRRSKLK